MSYEYLSVSETSKLIRAALKKAFPGVKFSVRSSKYAGGASVNVDWVDGPCDKAVSLVTGQFSGGGFDGMIDLKYNHSSWLLPDGSAIVADNPGTQGSMGMVAPERNEKPDPAARLVRFGADYVFTQRKLSPELLNRAKAKLGRLGYPVEVVEIERSDWDGSAVVTVHHDPVAARGFDMEREIWQQARKTHCVKAS
jgi:hypothetical protein